MPKSGNIYYTVFPEQGDNLRELILIHGAGGSGEQWPYQIRRLPGWRVYAMDLPAHGKSNGIPEKNIEGYAAQVREWMRRIGIERAGLIGHSMGAAIALMLALQAPERVDRLILVGGAARFPVNPNLLEKLRVPLRFEDGVNMIVGWSFARNAEPQLRKDYFAQLMANQPGVLLQDFAACATFDLGERVKEIRRPALLLSGDEDAMVPQGGSQTLAGELIRGKAESVKGAGHMLMRENPQAVVALIEKYLGTAN